MWTRLSALLLFLLTYNPLAFSQNTWKLTAAKDGIRIYTRPIADSKIKAIKVECSLSATPAQLVAVIIDIDKSEDWVYHAKAAKVIKQVSPVELYYYSEVVVPWPAENRDYISHIIVSQDARSKVVTVNAPCIFDMVSVKPGIVRIKHSIGKWTIAPTDRNKIQVEYELEVDPAGAIPAWLVNMFATKGPLETFEKLKIQIQKPEYKKAKFGFISE